MVIVKKTYVIRKMDHVTFVYLVTMVIHAMFHVQIVMRDHVIKMVAVPWVVKQASSWTDVMQHVLKTVTKHVTSKVEHVPADARTAILETIVKLPVQYIVLSTATKKMADVLKDAMKDILERLAKKAAQKTVQLLNVVKLMVPAQRDVRMDGWESNAQKVSRFIVFTDED